MSDHIDEDTLESDEDEADDDESEEAARAPQPGTTAAPDEGPYDSGTLASDEQPT